MRGCGPTPTATTFRTATSETSGRTASARPIANSNFGKNNPTATRYDPGTLNGYGKRDSNWDFTTEVQHELMPGFAITGGYYRNTGGYFRYAFGSPFSSKLRVDGQPVVGPGELRSVLRHTPADRALPGGGGYQQCGYYNLNPTKVGQVENLVNETKNYGDFISSNDFFNVAIDARLAKNIRLGGGFDTGRSVQERCFVVDSPAGTALLPRRDTLQRADPVQAARRVPDHVRLRRSSSPSRIWRDRRFGANYTATNAEIIPTLGRPLSAGAHRHGVRSSSRKRCSRTASPGSTCG